MDLAGVPVDKSSPAQQDYAQDQRGKYKEPNGLRSQDSCLSNFRLVIDFRQAIIVSSAATTRSVN